MLDYQTPESNYPTLQTNSSSYQGELPSTVEGWSRTNFLWHLIYGYIYIYMELLKQAPNHLVFSWWNLHRLPSIVVFFCVYQGRICSMNSSMFARNTFKRHSPLSQLCLIISVPSAVRASSTWGWMKEKTKLFIACAWPHNRKFFFVCLCVCLW